MTTTARETALAALDTVLRAVAVAQEPPVTVLDRNSEIPALDGEVTVSGPAHLFALLRDGDAIQPDVLLGDPPIYDHLQQPMLEVAAAHPDAPVRDTAMDVFLAAFAAALASDPTLGGACALVQPSTPDFSTIGDTDAPMGKACDLGIDLMFQSGSPIG